MVTRDWMAPERISPAMVSTGRKGRDHDHEKVDGVESRHGEKDVDDGTLGLDVNGRAARSAGSGLVEDDFTVHEIEADAKEDEERESEDDGGEEDALAKGFMDGEAGDG